MTSPPAPKKPFPGAGGDVTRPYKSFPGAGGGITRPEKSLSYKYLGARGLSHISIWNRGTPAGCQNFDPSPRRHPFSTPPPPSSHAAAAILELQRDPRRLTLGMKYRILSTEPNLPRTEPKVPKPKYSVPVRFLVLGNRIYRGIFGSVSR